MKRYQDRVLEKVESIAAMRGCEVVVASQYSNTGELLAHYPKGSFNTIASLRYHFQPGHNKVTFNGESLGPSPMSWLWSEREDDKVNGMFAQWRLLVEEGIAQHKER